MAVQQRKTHIPDKFISSQKTYSIHLIINDFNKSNIFDSNSPYSRIIHPPPFPEKMKMAVSRRASHRAASIKFGIKLIQILGRFPARFRDLSSAAAANLQIANKIKSLAEPIVSRQPRGEIFPRFSLEIGRRKRRRPKRRTSKTKERKEEKTEENGI